LTDAGFNKTSFQLGKAFPQFSKLPLELRLMVWTHTWPAPRIIEAAICEDETKLEEYEDVAILRLAGPLLTILKADFGSRVVEGGPNEFCDPPVSLQVCHESRKHTLTGYRRMKHSAATKGSFYFNPHTDVLWLSADFTDRPQYLDDLVRCYGPQLDNIHILLAEESELEEYTRWYLKPFGGLRTMLLLVDSEDSDTDEYSNPDDSSETSVGAEAQAADGDDAGNADDASVQRAIGADGENRGRKPSTAAAELYARAKRLKGEHGEVLGQLKPPQTFWCIDRDGTRF
jgi:hypothetical protein